MFVAAVLGGSGSSAAAPAGERSVKDGGTLVTGAPSLDFIDPALVADPTSASSVTSVTAAWAIEDASCALLLRYPAGPPPVRFDLVPEVAAGYPAVSRDGRTLTFTVRSGYRFSTGAPVTAQNYAYAINRVLNPLMRSPAAKYFQEIVGADAMQQGTAQTASGVTVAGNRLIIGLTKRVPDFPARMTMPYLCPVPTDLPIDPEGVAAPLPGSGPYYIAEFVRGSRVVLKRNPYYTGPRVHHLDQIVFQVGDDAGTWSSKVEAGTADVDLGVPTFRIADLGAKYGVNKTQFWSVRSANVFYLYMNTARPLFRNNVKLRQAVNFALDRTAMLKAFGWYGGTVTDDYLPPGLSGYVDAHVYPLDHPDLKQALKLARGHTRSGKAVMYTCDNVFFACLAHAQIVQADLKAIGIDVQIEQFPVPVWQAKISTSAEPFDLAIDRPIEPWVDPYLYVNLLLDGRVIQPTGNTNRSQFDSPHYNRLIDQAAALSGSARYDAYGRLAVDIARNAAPMAAIFVRNTRFLISSRVGCIGVAAHGLDLAGLCLK